MNNGTVNTVLFQVNVCKYERLKTVARHKFLKEGGGIEKQVQQYCDSIGRNRQSNNNL